ncbi:MAG: type II/IV secretion system protein [Patescibacteria group bacterium]|nr:type II/IV secretion system protein [Patescibacteria group bacterium]MDE2438113.1 type II/IV secretion system protein [Patescibacteria group bacterium]
MDEENVLIALVQRGYLPQATLTRLRKEAELSGKTVEALLYDRKMVDDRIIAQTKSELSGIPLKVFEKNEVIPSDTLHLISEEMARTYEMIPLSLEGNFLTVGVVHPENAHALEALTFLAKEKKWDLGIYIISFSDFVLQFRAYTSFSKEIENAVGMIHAAQKGTGEGHTVVRLEEKRLSAEEAPVIKVVARILNEAVTQGASDIHIEPQRNAVRIRFRLDGDLHTILELPPELHNALISRIKILSDLKIDETRIPQDGRFRTLVERREIDFRVATFPTVVGEKVALRVLDPTIGLKKIDDLGLMGQNLALVREALTDPFGMILITGPTGSGKSTTLYGLMRILATDTVNVVTLEDPVEYYLAGMNQSQVKPEIGYDFASGLRQILRQDPDVIMVGEIRDNETAELAVHAALTGHIVLSTLHTNNSIGVIPRLIDMKIESFLLPSSLNLMLAQRLVTRLCDDCKKKEPLDVKLAAIVEAELKKIPDEEKKDIVFKPPYEVYAPQGCDKCNDKGFRGRLAIFEVLKMTRELSDILQHDTGESAIVKESERQKMITLRQDGILKALRGLLYLPDVMKETSEGSD